MMTKKVPTDDTVRAIGFTFDKKIRLDILLTILSFIIVTAVGYTRLQSQVEDNTKHIQEAEATFISKEAAVLELRSIKNDVAELKEIQKKDHDVLVEISTQLKELNKKR